MKKEDIKILIGNNLKRLRRERRLTQDALGEILKPDPVDGSHIAAIEAGKGVSDEMLARLCNALKAKFWEFCIDESTPIVRSPSEARRLQLIRQEQQLGIDGEIIKYEVYRIAEAMREISPAEKKTGKAVRDVIGELADVMKNLRGQDSLAAEKAVEYKVLKKKSGK